MKEKAASLLNLENERNFEAHVRDLIFTSYKGGGGLFRGITVFKRYSVTYKKLY